MRGSGVPDLLSLATRGTNMNKDNRITTYKVLSRPGLQKKLHGEQKNVNEKKTETDMPAVARAHQIIALATAKLYLADEGLSLRLILTKKRKITRGDTTPDPVLVMLEKVILGGEDTEGSLIFLLQSQVNQVPETTHLEKA